VIVDNHSLYLAKTETETKLSKSTNCWEEKYQSDAG